MALEIQGIAMRSIRLYHEYFDFKEVYESIIKDKGHTYYAFYKKYFADTAKKVFDIDDDTDNPIRVILNPKERVGRLAYFDFNEENRRYSMKMLKPDDKHRDEYVYKLCEYVKTVYSTSWIPDKEGNPREDYPQFRAPEDETNDAGYMLPETKKFLDNLRWQRGNAFSPEGAALIFLYLFLHGQAGVLPTNEKSVAQLDKMLNRSEGANGALSYNAEEQRDNPSPLRIEKWSYPGNNGKPHTFVQNNLKRTVGEGESVFAVLKGGQFISFLPRATVTGSKVHYAEGQALYCYNTGREKKDQAMNSRPACWTFVGANTIVTDDQGRIIRKEYLGEIDLKDADGKIVSASSGGGRWGALLNDGSVRGGILQNNINIPDKNIPGNWKNLIYLSVGVNGGIAINNQGHAILENGIEIQIQNFEPTEACAANGHYICLDRYGKVKTDHDRLNIDKTFYAVAICGAGYVAATIDTIGLYSFDDGGCIGSYPAQAEELAASGDIIVYYDNEGRCHTLKIQGERNNRSKKVLREI